MPLLTTAARAGSLALKRTLPPSVETPARRYNRASFSPCAVLEGFIAYHCGAAGRGGDTTVTEREGKAAHQR